MGRTVLWDGVPEPGNRPPAAVRETRTRAFLRSWTMGAILAVGCVLGVLAIVSANPFASASASERISDTLGQPVSCTEVGAAVVGDEHSTVYRCAAVGIEKRNVSRCYAVSGDDIRQLSGRREFGC